MLLNVLSNALKFQEVGKIIVSLSTNRLIDSSKIRVELTVLDRGIGIPVHEVEKVFDLLWTSKDVTHRRLNPDG